MKSISELNPKGFKTNPSIDKNLKILFDRLIELQDASEIDFVITSGLRSDEKQAQLIAEGKTNAVHSRHTSGHAADIYDPNKELQKWILDNAKFLEVVGLWAEDFDYCKNWVHLQTTPPKSGKRFFIP